MAPASCRGRAGGTPRGGEGRGRRDAGGEDGGGRDGRRNDGGRDDGGRLPQPERAEDSDGFPRARAATVNMRTRRDPGNYMQ